MIRYQRAFAALFVVLLVGGLLALSVAVARGRQDVRQATSRLATSLAGVEVVDAAGRSQPIVPDGGVVMVIASTCPHCHAVLARLAEVAGGEALPRLRVITLDGARRGQLLLDSLHIRAVALGPAGEAKALVERLGVSGTPSLFHADAAGKVRERTVGELSEVETRAWAAWAR
jgi:hypothetical protein